jgi:hypothetical protein
MCINRIGHKLSFSFSNTTTIKTFQFERQSTHKLNVKSVPEVHIPIQKVGCRLWFLYWLWACSDSVVLFYFNIIDLQRLRKVSYSLSLKKQLEFRIWNLMFNEVPKTKYIKAYKLASIIWKIIPHRHTIFTVGRTVCNLMDDIFCMRKSLKTLFWTVIPCIPVGNPVVRSSNNFSSSELGLYFM